MRPAQPAARNHSTADICPDGPATRPPPSAVGRSRAPSSTPRSTLSPPRRGRSP